MTTKKTASFLRIGVRQKVLLVLVIVLLAALTISGWLALNEEKHSALKEIEQRGTDISRFVAKSLAFSVVGYDYHTMELLLEEITSSEEISYARVLNSKGLSMVEAGAMPDKNSTEVVIFNQDMMINGEKVGALLLGLSTKNIMARLESQKYNHIRRELMIILMIAFAEFLALSYIIVRPVSIITESLNNHDLEDGAIVGTIPITSNDEFGQLATQFNSLSFRLNRANKQLTSRIDFADDQLVRTNKQLSLQSSELREMNSKLKQLSVTDPLTELFNRRFFEESLESEVALSRRHGYACSLLVLDIDHFKIINDTYGHTNGDTTLKSVADNLKQHIRETDLLCRFGGEEFVIICRRAEKQSALLIAENLRSVIESLNIHIAAQEINLTISIGIATIDADNVQEQGNQLFHHADKALYYSKHHGRNIVTHFDDLPDEQP